MTVSGLKAIASAVGVTVRVLRTLIGEGAPVVKLRGCGSGRRYLAVPEQVRGWLERRAERDARRRR